MRILHVVPTYLPATRYGGPIHSVHGLCKALAQRGHEVQVYTTNVDGRGTSAVPVGVPVALDGVNVTYFAAGWPRRIYRSPAMARQLGRAVSGFDVVHIHSVFLWPGLAASWAARRASVPYVVSPRGMLVPELIARKSHAAKSLWLAAFDRRILGAAAAVHLTSRREVQDLEHLGISTRKVVVVPNGLDIPQFDDAARRGSHVLFLGRLDPKKGVDVLIRAVQQVPGAHLDIGGDGEPAYVAQLQQLVDRLALAARVRFLGHLDREQKWRRYRDAALFVLPSISENFGNAVLEAMAAGCPVIVSPGVGLADAVAHHGCGRVVDREPDKLADSIGELLASEALRGEMGKNGMRAAENYGWPMLGGTMAEVYEELASQHSCLTVRLEGRR